jgi:hypothetical protein
MYKIALKVIAVLVFFYGCAYMFNHCNAWIGIGGAVLGGIFLLDQLIKLLKNKL